MFRTYKPVLRCKSAGMAPAAARYAGFSSQRGALDGACCCPAAWPGWPERWRRPGRSGQLTPYVPAGYGFAAIIVAFVGRLHPVGIVFSGGA